MYSFFFLAAPGLHCYTWAFSGCSEWALLSRCGARLLTAAASLVVERGSRVHTLQWFRLLDSVVVVHGLSCPVTCGILRGQGSNEHAVYWKADSQCSDHQGSPT